MPVLTLTLSKDMVAAARVYAARDKNGFAYAPIPVMTPTEFLDWQGQ